MTEVETTIEFVPEDHVDAGIRAWTWLLRGDKDKLKLLASKPNRWNSEPIKYLFDCENCPALLLMKAIIVGEKIDPRITRSPEEWAQHVKGYADRERGIEYPAEMGGSAIGRGKGAVYDEENRLLRVVGHCSALMWIFDGKMIEETNCS